MLVDPIIKTNKNYLEEKLAVREVLRGTFWWKLRGAKVKTKDLADYWSAFFKSSEFESECSLYCSLG